MRSPLRIALALLAINGCEKKSPPPPADEVSVLGVIDGDTIELSDGRTVRLVGIDTPERGDAYFDSAAALTSRLLLNKSVRLEFDRDQTDRYGRTLAFTWTGDRLANVEIIRLGWGWCYFFTGNLLHSRELLLAQREAMTAHRGLWREPPIETAGHYRASFESFRFHRPECHSMDRVDTDLEVVFYSKDSAFYEGYSPCERCAP